ncbi:hypothetical protein GW17_00038824 [Ensete ventricosum]|nr:hypothetical protein GW17_00038824 [Ensete ventricosum]
MSIVWGLQPHPLPLFFPTFSSCNSLSLVLPIASEGKPYTFPSVFYKNPCRLHLRLSSPLRGRHQQHPLWSAHPSHLPPPPRSKSASSRLLPCAYPSTDNNTFDGGDNNNNDNNNNNNNNGNRWWHDKNPSFGPHGWWVLLPLPLLLLGGGHDDGDSIFSSIRVAAIVLLSLIPQLLFPFLTLGLTATAEDAPGFVWEVTGGRWTKLVHDPRGDCLSVDRGTKAQDEDGKPPFFQSLGSSWRICKDLAFRLLLPEGYPHSVSSDYLEYSLWRGVQGVASQISGVLSTQVHSSYSLYYFFHLLENMAYGLEIITPAFPQFFVLIGATAGASRSAASLIQVHNFMCLEGFRLCGVSECFMNLCSISVYNMKIQRSSTISFPYQLAYLGKTLVHTGPVADRYADRLLPGSITKIGRRRSISRRRLRCPSALSRERVRSDVIAKGEAQGMVSKFVGIMLGIAIGTYIGSSTPLALASFVAVTGLHMYCNFKSYQSIQLRTLNPYRACKFLTIDFMIILKEGCSPDDMLKSLFHANYLYWLERNVDMESGSAADECEPGGRLHISLDYVQREYGHIKYDGLQSGWITDGLVARPLPTRIRQGS